MQITSKQKQTAAKTGGTASCTNMKHTRKFKSDGYRGISLAYNGDKMRGRLTRTNTQSNVAKRGGEWKTAKGNKQTPQASDRSLPVGAMVLVVCVASY